MSYRKTFDEVFALKTDFSGVIDFNATYKLTDNSDIWSWLPILCP